MSKKALKLSPSAVAKFRFCARKYAFEYNQGFWAPTTDKQQFGKDVHKKLEEWLQHKKVPDNSPEGMTAKQGLKYLPEPGADLLIEHEMQYPFEKNLNLGGFIDCVVPPGRMEKIPVVIDHKTTSDLRWAKNEILLSSDAQCLIYAMWAMIHFNAPEIKCRWVYYAASNPPNNKPRKPTGSRAIDIIVSKNDPDFFEHVKILSQDIKKMAQIRRAFSKGLDMPPSPAACETFGGCYHKHRCNLSPGERLAAHMEHKKII